jgi:hypothetical protein
MKIEKLFTYLFDAYIISSFRGTLSNLFVEMGIMAHETGNTDKVVKLVASLQ